MGVYGPSGPFAAGLTGPNAPPFGADRSRSATSRARAERGGPDGTIRARRTTLRRCPGTPGRRLVTLSRHGRLPLCGGRWMRRMRIAAVAVLSAAAVTVAATAGPAGAQATASAPVRVLDTRSGVGAPAHRLNPGETLALAVP